MKKIGGDDVQGELKFETFMDAYRGEFDEYLSSSIVDIYATQQHKEIMDEQDMLYKRYPKVKDVIDMDKPYELSEEECAALVRVCNLKNKLIAVEMQDVYFKGCGDCVGYLKKMKLL